MADAMEAAEQLSPSALSSAFAALATRPVLRQRIVADPGVTPPAGTELLRAEGPVVTLPRVATRDVQIAGRTIPGPHACPGSHLAPLEMRVVMEKAYRRIPFYRLGPGGSDRDRMACVLDRHRQPVSCLPAGRR